jgi:uncharacterized RDD family membrane protein YckC
LNTPSPSAAPPPAGGPGFTPGQGPEAVCAECGKLFAVQDMIRHGGAYICAGCKPVFMQKLAEGVELNTRELSYAGFWIRFGAYFLDMLILMAVNLCIGMIAGLSLAQAAGVRPKGAMTLQLVFFAINMTVGIAYEVLLLGTYGATLGKMACNIKVVKADGSRISYLRAFGRYFGKILSSFTCLIGFIMAGFDSQKRALHDYVCNTRVVFK